MPIFLFLLELLPIIVVAYNSFQNTSGTMFVEGYSFNSYIKAFNSMGSSIANTYLYSITALTLILVIGILTSYSAVRRPSVLTAILDTTTMFPYIIPGSVLGIAMLLAFNHRPLLISGTALIIIVTYVVRRLPYTIRSSNAILRQISPSVEEAALSLGASSPKTFTKITVPHDDFRRAARGSDELDVHHQRAERQHYAVRGQHQDDDHFHLYRGHSRKLWCSQRSEHHSDRLNGHCAVPFLQNNGPFRNRSINGRIALPAGFVL